MARAAKKSSKTNTKKDPKKVTAQAPRKNAAGSTAKTYYWSGHKVVELIKQCKSRNIPLPSNTLKRQEYIDKLHERIKAGNNGARDWKYLLVKDLKKECDLLGIDTAGLTKQKLIQKLEKDAKDEGDDDCTDPNPGATGGAPPNNGPPGSVPMPWNKKMKLAELKEICRDRGVLGDLKLKREFVAALEEDDAQRAGKAAGKGDSDEDSEASRKQVWPLIGKHAEGRTPSPTMSDGQEFEHCPQASPDAIFLSGLDAPSGTSRGFENEGPYCYRNAVLVLLFHSRKILSWLQHRYLPALEDAGLTVATYCGPRIRQVVEDDMEPLTAEEEERSTDAYTDVWCELYQLSLAYWDSARVSQDHLDRGKKIFWTYLTNIIARKQEVGQGTQNHTLFSENDGIKALHKRTKKVLRDQDQKQQCAFEFVHLLIIMGAEQLETFCELNDVFVLKGLDVREMLLVSQTRRFRCVWCDVKDRAKNRVRGLEHLDGLALSIAVEQDIRGPGSIREVTYKPTVTLEECLKKNSKGFQEGGRCVSCDKRYEEELTKQDGVGRERLQAKAQKLNSIRTYEWRKFCRLPEVLLISLTRSIGVKSGTKADICVEFGETLDLQPFVDEKLPPPSSSKYRLVGLVNHKGTLGGGHYINQVRNGNEWLEINDEKVETTTFDAILQAQRAMLKDKKGKETKIKVIDRWTPYLLMYERITDDGAGNDNDANGRTRRNDNDPGSNAEDGNGDDDDDAGNANRQANGPRTRGRGRPQQNSNGPASKSGHGTNDVNSSAMNGGRVHSLQIEAEKRDLFVRFCSKRDAEWCRIYVEQNRHIAWQDDIIKTLQAQKADLEGFVALGQKRRYDQISVDDIEPGGDHDTVRLPKRGRQTDLQGASTDVVVGSPDDIANMGMLSPDGYYELMPDNDDAYDSDGRLIEDEYHDADSQRPGDLDVTDSDSASMSESEDEIQAQPHEMEDEGEEEILSSPLDLRLFNEYRIIRNQQILANPELARKREVAKHTFADDYADHHNILRAPGYWSWMGPRHQEHFKEELEWFLDEWEEWALHTTFREEQEERRSYPRRILVTPRTPSYSPESPEFEPITPTWESDSPNAGPTTPSYEPSSPDPTPLAPSDELAYPASWSRPSGFHKRAPSSIYSQLRRRLWGTPNGHMPGDSLPDYVDSDAEEPSTVNRNKQTASAAAPAKSPNQPKTSPSAKFYSIGKRNTAKPSPRSDRLVKKTTLKSSPRKNQIPSPPISSPRHPAKNLRDATLSPLREEPGSHPLHRAAHLVSRRTDNDRVLSS
ncbi:hypothetical protein H2200_005444 [Cladophialophora chaetospira]|uniref:USP domain-containing protein n=1 Tax=Cladophialophora chaetospira TaxID=386627 RepID=A0AA39CJL5_9EURO|nr:hypothetical protein H2200_005444 [Cladophialophora chaetospira]